MFAQAFLNIVMKDAEFFTSNKSEAFTKFMKEKSSSSAYTMGNTFNGALDLTSKESIILKFK